MSEPRGVQAAGPAFILGGGLLVLAAVAVLTSPAPVELDGSLENWLPGEAAHARLTEIRSRRAAAPGPEDATRVLVDAWRAASAAPFVPGPTPKRRVMSAEQRFRSLASEYIDRYGVPAYAAAGEGLAGLFITALDELAAAAGQGHKGTWLSAHRELPVAREVRGLGGQFPERALASGLLAPVGPLDPDRREVARILWTLHWYETARPGLSREVMSPQEHLLVQMWKVEDATHLGFERRMEILEEVQAAAPDYPADFVRGVLATRYGHLEDARSAFEQALDDGYQPDLVQRWLTLLGRSEAP
jgi:hypothetical protein